ncbi:hypothetical protein DNTS_005336 [Danionella cerebrum]|uniref:ZPR1 jelly-roll domain-containing protein n=1 Tax=Danionella cerebrum TaxID=2873325 RepID=A0A553MWR6_9TELE|nr:hypothetical protein DNTS_005336 [Danionella translucida]
MGKQKLQKVDDQSEISDNVEILEEDIFKMIAKGLEPLHNNDTVRLEDCNTWSKRATVLEQVNPRSYTVKTEDGHHLRRNRRSLLKTKEPAAVENAEEEIDCAVSSKTSGMPSVQEDKDTVGDLSLPVVRRSKRTPSEINNIIKELSWEVYKIELSKLCSTEIARPQTEAERLETGVHLLGHALVQEIKTTEYTKDSIQAEITAKGLEPLHNNDTVRLEDCNTWSKRATVLEQVNPRSYIVKTEDGHHLRRNRRSLLKTKEPAAVENAEEEIDCAVSSKTSGMPSVQEDKDTVGDLSLPVVRRSKRTQKLQKVAMVSPNQPSAAEPNLMRAGELIGAPRVATQQSAADDTDSTGKGITEEYSEASRSTIRQKLIIYCELKEQREHKMFSALLNHLQLRVKERERKAQTGFRMVDPEKSPIQDSEGKQIIAGEMDVHIILDDPAGNSYLQNVYAPEPDPEMKMEKYMRSFEQNEDLGLNDMKTEGYGEK